MASTSAPHEFIQVVDFEIAMGWENIVEGLEKKQPEAVAPVPVRLAHHFAELNDAWSGPRALFSLPMVKRAARDLGQPFGDQLPSP